ncbi:MAG: type IV secretion system protein [Sphingomonas sp.]|uniref:type IV secretion system protein n=1 Tax=Sphingomonas sp. TaxID=28214 RepID=UPI001ACD2228|nr:type IV secretion system protein [Sphingomonas sp.]MBN8809650.1 type IV secretion system protein [Sphingomonas sp.]
MACPAISDTAFLGSVLAHVDCQAQTIGQGGYLALSTPGSAVQIVAGIALTLFIALIGYRLLLGDSPSVRESVVAAVKVGVALMLATSWPAFHTLAYDVAMQAPGEVAADIAAPSGLSTAPGLTGQLQLVDDAMAELALLGTGQPLGATTPPTQGSALDQARSDAQVSTQRYQQHWDPARDFSLLGSARTVFLTATIAAFSAARLLAGLALAIGPLFVLFLLFDATRSLVEGWIRVLAGAALGALAVSLVLGVEIALVLPWLTGVLELRYQNVATPEVPVELLVLSLVFALTLLAVLVGAARMAQAFRFAPMMERLRVISQRAPTVSTSSQRVIDQNQISSSERSRALAIADAVAASQRRETSLGDRAITIRNRADGAGGVRASDPSSYAGRLGQQRRRTGSRVSAGSRRRDRMA